VQHVVEAVLVGMGLGFSLAAPPGPVMAKMASETARGRWRQGLLVGTGAMSADAMFFALVTFGLLAFAPDPRVLAVLAFAGVGLMLYFAYGAWRVARRPLVEPKGGLNGWPAGFVLAATSPFNFAWWATSGGPLLEVYGPVLGIGFFAALVTTVAVAVYVFHLGSRKIARFEAYVSYASALLLVGFAFILAWNGIGFVRAA
jgi:threonine/homoserine/homoserine lactone efflux protein